MKDWKQIIHEKINKYIKFFQRDSKNFEDTFYIHENNIKQMYNEIILISKIQINKAYLEGKLDASKELKERVLKTIEHTE